MANFIELLKATINFLHPFKYFLSLKIINTIIQLEINVWKYNINPIVLGIKLHFTYNNITNRTGSCNVHHAFNEH